MRGSIAPPLRLRDVETLDFEARDLVAADFATLGFGFEAALDLAAAFALLLGALRGAFGFAEPRLVVFGMGSAVYQGARAAGDSLGIALGRMLTARGSIMPMMPPIAETMT